MNRMWLQLRHDTPLRSLMTHTQFSQNSCAYLSQVSSGLPSLPLAATIGAAGVGANSAASAKTSTQNTFRTT